jgi:hypothetical protein
MMFASFAKHFQRICDTFFYGSKIKITNISTFFFSEFQCQKCNNNIFISFGCWSRFVNYNKLLAKCKHLKKKILCYKNLRAMFKLTVILTFFYVLHFYFPLTYRADSLFLMLPMKSRIKFVS